jgi:hypothetical protein
MDAAALDLAEVGKQVGKRDIRSRGQLLHRDEQIVVRDGRQNVSLNHVAAYTRDPEVPTLPEERRSCAPTKENSNSHPNGRGVRFLREREQV